jgi:HNH endonuclease
MKPRSAKNKRKLIGTYLRPLINYRQATNGEEYLLQRILKNGTCWNFTGPADKDRYGQIQSVRCAKEAKVTRAHQLAYCPWKGKINKLLVCHYCDNPKCINPDHLFLGTSQDNMTDKMKKGRYKNGTSK